MHCVCVTFTSYAPPTSLQFAGFAILRSPMKKRSLDTIK